MADPKAVLTTEDIINTMVETGTRHATEQGRHIFREALRALVRHAKAEQLYQMKKDVRTAIGNAPAGD